ncbi:MAG: lysophospholipid acyltransferase family protein [Thermoanaerobaculia bacterium]
MTVNRPLPLGIRRLLRLLLLAPAKLLGGFRIEGAARLPAHRRPMILVCNHAAWADSVYLILALRPRFTICGAKPPYFATAPRRALMAIANILPVDPADPVDGHEIFLADCRTLLAAGEILLIYPEMGRNPAGLGEFRTWAAEAALANRAPLLPCYLHGTTRGHSGPPRLIVGEPMEPAGTAGELTRRLYHAVAALAPVPAPDLTAAGGEVP